MRDDGSLFSFHFVGEETEVQNIQVTCPKSCGVQGQHADENLCVQLVR